MCTHDIIVGHNNTSHQGWQSFNTFTKRSGSKHFLPEKYSGII